MRYPLNPAYNAKSNPSRIAIIGVIVMITLVIGFEYFEPVFWVYADIIGTQVYYISAMFIVILIYIFASHLEDDILYSYWFDLQEIRKERKALDREYSYAIKKLPANLRHLQDSEIYSLDKRIADLYNRQIDAESRYKITLEAYIGMQKYFGVYNQPAKLS